MKKLKKKERELLIKVSKELEIHVAKSKNKKHKVIRLHYK